MIGTAGWSIPRSSAPAFPADGTHLERYARVLPCVEINSSFYRTHATTVYEKWAAQTPRHFRFSVKLPKLITHTQRLRRTRLTVTEFLQQISGLGTRLGPILVQLPPSLEFGVRAASSFFSLLRDLHDGPIVCEPRNQTWFAPPADQLLHRFQVGRVAADPAVTDVAAQPAGWGEFVYYRLHGSPRKYWSSYPADRLTDWAREMRAHDAAVWCIFDNTASGAATANALSLATLTNSARQTSPDRVRHSILTG